MNYFDILKLEERLKNNEELTDEEYKEIIGLHKEELMHGEYILSIGDYSEEFLNYMVLKKVAQMMGNDAFYLSDTADYMMGSLSLNKLHYREAVFDCKKALSHVSRLNTLNFLRHANEVYKYDELSARLFDSLIEETADHGYSVFKENILEDKINALEETHNKIKVLRKKYF